MLLNISELIILSGDIQSESRSGSESESESGSDLGARNISLVNMSFFQIPGPGYNFKHLVRPGVGLTWASGTSPE